MTTFTYTAYSISSVYDGITGQEVSAEYDIDVNMVVSAPADSGFSYEYLDNSPADYSSIVINNSGSFDITVDGVDPLSYMDDATIVDLNWADGNESYTTAVLFMISPQTQNADGDYEEVFYIFELGGDAFPPVNSEEEFAELTNGIFAADATTWTAASGPYAPGKTILWSDLPYTSIDGTETETESMITGTNGDEALIGTAADDEMDAKKGDDKVAGLEGNDTLEGGKGNDTVDYSKDADAGGTSKAVVNLEKGTATDGFGTTDTLSGFENIKGTDKNDKLIGDAEKNEIKGRDGDDTIKGGEGKDELIGGAGDDSIKGGDGSDEIDAGKGDDTIEGGNGNDEIDAGKGNDTIDGGKGQDEIEGGKGSDIIDGGKKDDVLTGDGGADLFVFSGNFGNDVITDFAANKDSEQIDLSDVGAIKGWNDLSKNHMTQSGDNVLIDDLNGNTIELEDVLLTKLDANDFIF